MSCNVARGKYFLKTLTGVEFLVLQFRYLSKLLDLVVVLDMSKVFGSLDIDLDIDLCKL